MKVALPMGQAQNLLLAASGSDEWRDDAFEIILNEIVKREKILSHGRVGALNWYWTWIYVAYLYCDEHPTIVNFRGLRSVVSTGVWVVLAAARHTDTPEEAAQFEDIANRMKALIDMMPDAPFVFR